MNNTDLKGGTKNLRYNPDKPVCKSPEEIDEYVRDVEIQHWIVEEQIYWLKYN
jgi:hypothetical protein